MDKAPFGTTGHQSSRAIFGAAALSDVTQARADEAVETVLAHGVNHFDTAASYGDSELRLGPWLERHRSEVFLATKTGERLKDAALDELHRSLERLRTDHVDLWQLHNLVDAAEWEVALGPGGALEAAVTAREEGLIRFIGITGHGLEVAARHRASLERFSFDSVLLPFSFVMMQNQAYAAEFEALAGVCNERGVAVQTIKAVTRRPWGDRLQDRSTWYQPLEDPHAIGLAVHWVMGREGFFLNTVGDVDLLPRVLDEAARFERRPSDEAMAALVRDEEMAPLFA
ncbi:MAG TPA: aldo/keto reductase [Trueperaceae bacterium]|nr:aldo/keto reductase [Trueperaceae bacterium]